MADLTAKQIRNQLSSPPVTPDRSKFSEDQLKAIDAATAGHQAATQDPIYNGEDSRRRLTEGTNP
jgi:hypothetical protein